MMSVIQEDFMSKGWISNARMNDEEQLPEAVLGNDLQNEFAKSS